jgi:hypothetical protein
MTEAEFIEMLVEAGWDRLEATEEAHQQYHGDLGDCDGDLGP